MKKQIVIRIATTAALLLSGVAAFAQSGAYSSFSPYSIFGFGDISEQGTAYHRTMGGVGIASRNNRFINSLNPAAITARDTLSVMMDFSLAQNNKIFRQGDIKSANNTFTVNDCLLTFPIFKTMTAMVGITPFSAQGYKFADYPDDPKMGKVGTYGYSAEGQGSVYQIVAALGYTFFDRLSVGAEYIHYFGRFDSTYGILFTDESYQQSADIATYKIHSDGAKFGLQYEQPLGNRNFISVGATYRLASRIHGTYESYLLSDTTKTPITGVSIAADFGVGVALNLKEKFRFEVDYTRSDWTNTGLTATSMSPGVGFAPSVSQAIRIGAEYIPNRNDIRYYFKRAAYRLGAYRKSEYYNLNGNKIYSTGVTLGGTFPIFRWSNGLTAGIDVGKRGNIQNTMIREWYFNLSFGLNLYDIWFQKYRYE